MSTEKELNQKNDGNQESVDSPIADEIEGYASCTTQKNRCLTDCFGLGAFIVDYK